MRRGKWQQLMHMPLAWVMVAMAATAKGGHRMSPSPRRAGLPCGREGTAADAAAAAAMQVSGVMISTALDVFTHDGAHFNHGRYYDFNEQNRKSLTGGTGHRLAARRLARRMT
jgi:hypothetical protein